AGLTQLFYYKSRQSLASSFLHILPTWLLAGLLMVAYFSDMIPPVPLVKLEAAVGAELEKANGVYLVQVSAPAWWQVWRLFSDEVHIKQGEKLYYITAVFAPHGLQTRLYHRWEYRHGKNWVATPRIGFTLNGGRQAGFRGYTYKQNLQSGDWRVVVETEDAHTVSVDTFTLLIDNTNAPIQRKPRPI
ncbi:MAG: DUF2914 domain-containing protein, partial [Methylophilaceae bacterium]